MTYLAEGTTATVHTVDSSGHSNEERLVVKVFDICNAEKNRKNFAKESSVHEQLRRKRDHSAEKFPGLQRICISRGECDVHCSMVLPRVEGATLEQQLADSKLLSLKNNRRIAVELLSV
jgi:hypothetical protein